jgi:hypothetical protein
VVSDIETRVAASLHADAERIAAPSGMVTRAVTRAGVIRRRRRMAGAAVLVAAIAGTIAWPRLFAAGPHPPELPAAPSAVAPAAAAFGTDPRVLHFDMDLGALRPVITEWISAEGYEGFVAADASGRPRAEIYLGRDPSVLGRARTAPMWFRDRTGRDTPLLEPGTPEPVTVDGRPARLERQEATGGGTSVRVLHWQPRPGLYALAQTYGDDRDAPFTVAGALRLDRARTCAVPLRSAVPAGPRQVGCRLAMRVRPAGFVHSETRWAGPGGAVSIWAEDAEPGAVTPNTSVGGRPAVWPVGDPAGLWIPRYDGVQVVVQGADERRARAIAGGLTVATDLTRPSTWPG